MSSRIEGILPPHVTPFDKLGELDLSALDRLVDFWMDSGVHGLVTCASNGEGLYLSLEERVKVVERVVERSRGRPVVVGLSSPTTDGLIEQARAVRDVGASAVMPTPIFYYRYSDREILEHYRKFLSRCDLPVILYNVPKFVGYNMKVEILVRLTKEFDQVVGIKESSGLVGRISELIRSAKAPVLAGTGDTILPTLVLGGSGAVAGVSIIAPRMCVKLYELLRSGDLLAASELQLRLTELDEIVFKRYNQLSSVKEVLNLMGLPGGLPRRPSLPLSSREREELRRSLERFGLIGPDTGSQGQG